MSGISDPPVEAEGFLAWSQSVARAAELAHWLLNWCKASGGELNLKVPDTREENDAVLAIRGLSAVLGFNPEHGASASAYSDRREFCPMVEMARGAGANLVDADGLRAGSFHEIGLMLSMVMLDVVGVRIGDIADGDSGNSNLPLSHDPDADLIVQIKTNDKHFFVMYYDIPMTTVPAVRETGVPAVRETGTKDRRVAEQAAREWQEELRNAKDGCKVSIPKNLKVNTADMRHALKRYGIRPGKWSVLERSIEHERRQVLSTIDQMAEKQRQAEDDSGDSGDNRQLFPEGIPDDTDVFDVVVRIHEDKQKNSKDCKSMSLIAREYTGEKGTALKDCPKARKIVQRITQGKIRGTINV